MSGEIIFRSMGAEDCAFLAEIEKECFSEPWSEEAFYAELERDDAIYIVAQQKGEVCGYIGCHTVLDESYIANIAVRKKSRCKGIGEALLNCCIERCKSRNCSFISLEVRLSNEKAIRLYERAGFIKLGERKNFYSKPVENALIMTKYF